MFFLKRILNYCIENKSISNKNIFYLFNDIIYKKEINYFVLPIIIALYFKNKFFEISYFVYIMKKYSIKILLKKFVNLIDIVGTGGDNFCTFNISTISMFILSLFNVSILKHGNYGLSSFSGSANVLNEFGAKIKLNVKQVISSIIQTNIGFVLSSEYNFLSKNIKKLRRKIGVKTIFNIIGPLINPSRSLNMLVGVYNLKLLSIFIKIFKKLNINHIIILSGEDNLDEVTLSGDTLINELFNNKLYIYKINPRNFNINIQNINTLKVLNSLESKEKILFLLKNKKGPEYDISILNSGISLYASNSAISILEGVSKVRNIFNNDCIIRKIKYFIKITNSLN